MSFVRKKYGLLWGYVGLHDGDGALDESVFGVFGCLVVVSNDTPPSSLQFPCSVLRVFLRYDGFATYNLRCF